MMNQEIEYLDSAGHRILPYGFDVKKAERIMDNFLCYHRQLHTTFAEIASFLILRGTGYDGGTSSHYLCFLLGVDGTEMCTYKNWKARKGVRNNDRERPDSFLRTHAADSVGDASDEEARRWA